MSAHNLNLILRALSMVSGPFTDVADELCVAHLGRLAPHLVGLLGHLGDRLLPLKC